MAKGDIVAKNAGGTLETLAVGTDGKVLMADAASTLGIKWETSSGTGDVVGPAGATDNAIARFDTATGKLIQNSAATIADTTGSISINNAGGSLIIDGNTAISKPDGTTTKFARADGTWAAPSGTGDVTSTADTIADNEIVRYHETSGDSIQYSLATISDTGTINIPSGQTYNINGSAHTHTGFIADPGTSVDEQVLRWDGTSGDAVQACLLTVSDAGTCNIPSGQTYNINGSAHTHSSYVAGPASATDNAIVRFDATTGKLVQDSVVTIADTTGNMAGVGTLGCGAITSSGALGLGANAITCGGITHSADIVPSSDNARSMGSASASYANIYLGTANQIRSDSDVQFKDEGGSTYQDIDALSLKIGGTTVINSSGIVSNQVVGLTYVIDGGGSAITTGSKGFLEVPFAMTVTGWTILANASGSAVVDVHRCTYSGFPTTSSIAGTELPTLSTAQKNQDLSLSSWTTSLAAGDILEFIVDSASTVQRVTVSIRGTRA